MKRSHGLFTITILLGVGLCGIMYRCVRTGAESSAGSGLAPAKQPDGGATTPELADLAEMRREMVQLRRQLWAQGQRLAAVDPVKAQDSAAARDPRTDPEGRAEQERRSREFIASVDAAFRKETTDPGWSSATSSVVQTALSVDSDLRPLARGVECRSHTCRVEIADDSSGKLGKILPVFVQQVGQDLPSVITTRVAGAGGATLVLYMSRRDTPQAMSQ
ncbi:MAG: hypothetical protein E6J91_22515 [Deltaproteobacteria bacterium]|nr:MAG: hypothetical protein E6J91_22515 [Deltaproteobacteria bacterium]